MVASAQYALADAILLQQPATLLKSQHGAVPLQDPVWQLTDGHAARLVELHDFVERPVSAPRSITTSGGIWVVLLSHA
jgi:hypothetical protein